MSRVWVTLHDLAAGDLPPVCAKTGVRSATSCRVRFSNRPSCSAWLLPYSWGADLSAGRFRQRAVLGILPMSASARRRSMRALAAGRRTCQTGLGLLAAAAVGAVIAPASLLATGLLALAVGVLATSGCLQITGYTWSVGGRIERDGRSVRLSGVHPRFAQAVRRAYRTPPVAPVKAEHDSDVRVIPRAELERRMAAAS